MSMEGVQESGTMAFSPAFPSCADSDLLLRSSDNVLFAVHKAILSRASPIFLDMFVVGKQGDGIEPVPVAEESTHLEKLLKIIYPIEKPTFSSLDEILPVIAAAQKYEVQPAVAWLVSQMSVPLNGPLQYPRSLLTCDPLRTYAIARRFDIPELIQVARIAWLDVDPEEYREAEFPEIDDMPYKWYRELSEFRRERRHWLESRTWVLKTYLVETKGPDDFSDIDELPVTDDYDMEPLKTLLLKFPSLSRIQSIGPSDYFKGNAADGAFYFLNSLASAYHNRFP